MKILIIVDMQKDFLTGSLANPDAVAIVPGICDYIKNFKGRIVCTFDTHDTDYLSTSEGHYLPISHCIKGTSGWTLDDNVYKAIRDRYPIFIEKPTFGFAGWRDLELEAWGAPEEIIMVGTCTDICVISNALILKAIYPNIKITVLKDLCAGLSKEKHEAALEVMRSCQIEVI